MTGDRPTTPGWHCHRCRSTSCRQRADSDTDHVGRVEYRPLLLTQPSSVSWLWSHTHWCPSQRPQEVMRVDGSANPTMPKNPAQYDKTGSLTAFMYAGLADAGGADARAHQHVRARRRPRPGPHDARLRRGRRTSCASGGAPPPFEARVDSMPRPLRWLGTALIPERRRRCCSRDSSRSGLGTRARRSG